MMLFSIPLRAIERRGEPSRRSAAAPDAAPSWDDDAGGERACTTPAMRTEKPPRFSTMSRATVEERAGAYPILRTPLKARPRLSTSVPRTFLASARNAGRPRPHALHAALNGSPSRPRKRRPSGRPPQLDELPRGPSSAPEASWLEGAAAVSRPGAHARPQLDEDRPGVSTDSSRAAEPGGAAWPAASTADPRPAPTRPRRPRLDGAERRTAVVDSCDGKARSQRAGVATCARRPGRPRRGSAGMVLAVGRILNGSPHRPGGRRRSRGRRCDRTPRRRKRRRAGRAGAVSERKDSVSQRAGAWLRMARASRLSSSTSCARSGSFLTRSSMRSIA